MNFKIAALILFLLTITAIVGCGGSAVTSSLSGSTGGASGGTSDDSGDSTGGSSGDTTGGSTGTPGAAVTITGLLAIDNSATASKIKSQEIRPQAATLADGYIILATDVDSGSGTRTTTKSGAYSVELVQGSTYVFVLFDDNNRLAGVVTGTDLVDSNGQAVSGVVAQANERYVVSAFKPQGDEISTDITLNSNSGHAWWGKKALSGNFSLVPVDKYLARADSSGATVGNGANAGIGSGTDAQSGLSGTAVDTDLDGLPDDVDADANGNGVADSIEGKGTGTRLITTERIETASVFSNVGINPQTGKFQQDVVLQVGPKNAMVKSVQTVKVIAGPSWISTATFPTDDPSFKFSESVIGDGSGQTASWKTNDFRLFKVSSQGPTGGTQSVWSNRIYVTGTLKVGDTFTVQVSYADGKTETFDLMVDTVFNSVAQLATINDTSITSVTGSGRPGSPFVLSSRTVTLGITRPKDDKGNEIRGLNYQALVLYYSVEQGAGQLGPAIRFPQVGGSESILKDTGSSSAPLKIDVTFADGTINGEPFRTDELYVEIVATTPSGSIVLHSDFYIFKIP